MNVSDHFLRFILPFSFSPVKHTPMNLEELLSNMVDNGNEDPLTSGKIWEIQEKEERYLEFLFPFFQRFLSQKGQPLTCAMLAVTPRSLGRIFPNDGFEIWKQGKRCPIKINFNSVQLFLFHTGVGFLVLELEGTEFLYRLTESDLRELEAKLADNTKYLERLKDKEFISMQEFIKALEEAIPDEKLLDQHARSIRKYAEIKQQPSTEALADLAWHFRDLRLYGEIQEHDKFNPQYELQEHHYTWHLKADRCLLRRPLESKRIVQIPPDKLEKTFPHPFLARIHQRRENMQENTYDFPSLAVPELILFLMEPLYKRKDVNMLINKYLIGYHFVLTDPYPDQNEKASDLFYLRRNYDRDYQPTADDLSLEDNPELVCTFENITFGQSQEGGVTLVENNGHQFFEQFDHRVRFHYFMPFLLALHQRFALIHFAINMAELDTGNREEAHKIRKSVLDYVLRWRFGQVSNVTMYNRFYDNWRNILGLDTLLDEIKGEVDELDEHLERKRQRTMEKLYRRLETFIFPFLLITAVLGMNVYEFAQVKFSLFSKDFLGWFLLILALYFVPLSILRLLARKSLKD